MALIQRDKKDLLREDYYNALGEKVAANETKRIIEGGLIVDYDCFAKTKAEREVLKLAKLQAKLEDMRFKSSGSR